MNRRDIVCGAQFFSLKKRVKPVVCVAFNPEEERQYFPDQSHHISG